jgi:hypothetical protein
MWNRVGPKVRDDGRSEGRRVDGERSGDGVELQGAVKSSEWKMKARDAGAYWQT